MQNILFSQYPNKVAKQIENGNINAKQRKNSIKQAATVNSR